MQRLILIFIFCLGCSKATDLNLSDQQFQKWKNQKITDYEFTLRVNCFCTIEYVGPHNIVVKNNIIQSVNGVLYDPVKHPSVKTIEQLFEIIAANLKRKPFSKTLEYDPKYYFPANIFFDISEMVADEEIGYTVTQFKPL